MCQKTGPSITVTKSNNEHGKKVNRKHAASDINDAR